MKHKSSRVQINIRLSSSILHYFRSLAFKTGLRYQTLINSALLDVAAKHLSPLAHWQAAEAGRKEESLSLWGSPGKPKRTPKSSIHSLVLEDGRTLRYESTPADAEADAIAEVMTSRKKHHTNV